jgi:hypothetical protein
MKILDKYILTESMEFLGSDKPDKIINTLEYIMDKFSVNINIAADILDLSNKISYLRSSLQMINCLGEDYYSIIKKSKEDEYEKEVKKLNKAENDFLSLSNREKQITLNEFSLLYLDKLKENTNTNAEYEKFVQWLEKEKDYGIISSFCEFSDPGEYGRLRCYFEREQITPTLLTDFISNTQNY